MPTTNPYQFVPVHKDAVVPGMPVGQLGMTGSAATHDRFTEGSFTGRILCELTLEEDTVIGADQSSDTPAIVHPFEEDGRPAIPATTLRGMFSAVAEAASNSALRVLDNTFYTVREAVTDFLPAIGMIVIRNGSPHLRPVSMPMHRAKDTTGTSAVILNEYLAMFAEPFISGQAKTAPAPKVYLNAYHNGIPQDFLRTPNLQSYSADHREYWYVRLDGTFRPPGVNHEYGVTAPYAKPGGATPFLLGQRAAGHPISETAWRQKPASERDLFTRGLVRILDIPDRPANQPRTRKHEIFIPYPAEMEDYPAFPIPEEVWAEFHTVANEATERTDAADPPLPYHLAGSRRNDLAGRNVLLRDGDLVYFKPNRHRIERIALSAVWRRGRRSTHDYFRGISPELLPFHEGRTTISIAEQLFGFVENRDKENKPARREQAAADRAAKALAGRVQFSTAKLASGQPGPFYRDTTKLPSGGMLRILSSPKPPCPVMYFHPKNSPSGGHVAKIDLAPGNHAPNGRKFYVHRHGLTANQDKPWFTGQPTESTEQKVVVTPLCRGLRFAFHVDFENLGRAELELLCYSLRPAEQFRHKIGMGKSLGLGTIKIKPAGIFFVDPKRRYSMTELSLQTSRYHGAHWTGGSDEIWLETHPREIAAKGIPGGGFPSLADLRDAWKSRLAEKHASVAAALEVIGNPARVHARVQTPSVSQGGLEDETFKWFVANERGTRDNPAPHLSLPLITEPGSLPTLPELPPP